MSASVVIFSILTVISTLSVLPDVTAVKGVPRVCDGAVKHLHLAVGRDPSREMTISFASTWFDVENGDGENPVGGIFVGLTPNNLDQFVPEQEASLRYHVLLEHKTKPNETYYSPFQHHITLRNLSPSTTYHYVAVVGRSVDEVKTYPSSFERKYSNTRQQEKDILFGRDGSSTAKQNFRRGLSPSPYNGTSMPCLDGTKIRSFKTAPEQGVDGVTFAIVGDLGQFRHSAETLEHMASNRNDLDAVLLLGDVSYANGDHTRWDTFFDLLDDYPVFHSTPLLVATGNHDIEKQENGSDIFQAYEARFRMPRVRPARLDAFQMSGKLDLDAPPYPLPYDWGNAFYSFVYGSTIHIFVSAYSSMEPNSDQYRWLEEQLDSVDREATPWLLVSLHTPLYNSFAVHTYDPQIYAAKKHLEPLFVKFQVNVVFTGHIHAYQRTSNVAMGQVDEKGPIHITVGAGGRQCDAAFRSPEEEDWLRARDASFYGYGLFSVVNRTHADWSWIPLSPSGKKENLLHRNYTVHFTYLIGRIDKHGYNYVKGNKETKLPPLKKDHSVIYNQFFV